MRKRIVTSAHAIALVLIATANAQTPRKNAPTPVQKETFWQWVLRVSGVSANPNTLKGADDELTSGQIWVSDLAAGTVRKITPQEGYRSPVYMPDGNGILAVRGADVVRVSSIDGRAEKVGNVTGISKLVGFSLDAPDDLLVLKEDNAGHTSPWRFSVKSGAATPLPYDPQSSRDLQMLEHLKDWQRDYGGTIVYVKRESRETLSGVVEIENVFVKSASRDPVNVSRCDLTNCGQPSLSPDGNRVLFIKSVL
jgi:hypothetical protein